MNAETNDDRRCAEGGEPTDIKFLVDRLNKRREEGEDTGFESQCFILLEHFGKRNKAEKMFATMERMHCLLKILSDERMRGWTIDIKEPGCTLIKRVGVCSNCNLHAAP